jgi:hypothetical protein
MWILYLIAGIAAPFNQIRADRVVLSRPPSIADLIKPELLKRITQDREVLTSAHLDEGHYAFYAAMLVHAGVERTRRILTSYSLYSKLISYVDRTDYSPVTRILDIHGGIWKFQMRSWVKFEEKGDRWVHYHIVGGHFRGLEGDIFFESAGEKGTLVYFNGAQTASSFPPKFVIERGAEIVFGFTAKRMRNYLESNEDGKDTKSNEQAIPQPRAHL